MKMKQQELSNTIMKECFETNDKKKEGDSSKKNHKVQIGDEDDLDMIKKAVAQKIESIFKEKRQPVSEPSRKNTVI